MKLENPRGPVDLPPANRRIVPKRRRRGGKRRGWRVVIAPILLCAVVGVLVAADYRANAGEVHDGVKVGSVDLGGKTPAEAREIVKERITGPLEEIELKGPENFTRGAKEMGVEFKVEATVQKAYAVGREGNVFERLSERLRATFGSVSVPPGVDYRPAAARRQVEEIASRPNHEPRDASMTIEGTEVQVTGSREGYRMNIAATMRNVDAAVKNGAGEVKMVGETTEPGVRTPVAEQAAEKARAAMSEPLVLNARGRQWSLAPAQVGATLDVSRSGGGIRVSLDRERLQENLAGVFSQLTIEPVEADFVVQGSGVTVTPGQSGQGVEEEKLLDSVQAGIFEGQHSFEIPMAAQEPGLTTAEAERVKPTRVIGRYRTQYVGTGDASRARVENLRIASNAIDGTTVAPGEVFSANDILAPLDYNDAKVIINGKVESALGGGLCQIASTVYMAVNYAGLDVIERHPHYSELSYIRPGLDSTLWFGTANGYSGQELDMRFRNTSDAYVMVREYVADDGYLYAEVWGRPTGMEVEMDSRRVSASKWQTEWVTHQTVRQGGEVLFDGVLHRDTYEPLVDENGETVPRAAPAPVNP